MEELEYDVVVYGTGLVSSLVTSSLVRRLNYTDDGDTSKNNSGDSEKKKLRVLNVDKYGEYGSNYRTLTFKQLLSLENSQLLNSRDGLYDVKLSVVNQYLKLNDLTEDNTKGYDQKDNKIYYDLYPFWHNFDKLSDQHYLPTKQESTVRTAKETEESKDKQDEDDNEESVEKEFTKKSSTFELKVEEEDKEDQRLEGKLKKLFESSNSFNIDLYPRLILNNSLFLKYLVNSNLYKQLQLCTNNSSNVLYLFENDVYSPSSEKTEEKLTERRAAQQETTALDDHKDEKKNENKEETEEQKFEELMYDKNSIFRSNHLTNVEKRVLFRFLFHPKSVRSFDDTKKKRKNKLKEKERNGKEEDKEDERDKEDNDQMEQENVKENEKETNKTFEEFMKDSNLTYKLMDLVNYGMCFNHKPLSFENPKDLKEEMYKLNLYIKSYLSGKDSKGVNDVKNCFVYCLYGLSNLVQFICRLNSLHQCHHMLSNTVVSLSVSDSDEEENKDEKVDKDLLLSKETSKSMSKMETKETEESKDKQDEDNEESVEKGEKSGDEDQLKHEKGDKDEKKQDMEAVGNKDRFDRDNRILLKLDNYTVYTKYVVSEYDLTGVVEGFVPLENREEHYLPEDQKSKVEKEDNEDKKVLVVSLISNKKMFDSFNVCVVVPGRNVYFSPETRDKSESQQSKENKKKNKDSKSKNKETKEIGKDKEDSGEYEEVEGKERPLYVVQTCRDTLTAPEGMYVLYFMTMVDNDMYDSPVDVSSLFNYNGDDDSTECNSNNSDMNENNSGTGFLNNNTSNGIFGNKYSNYPELRRMLKVYEYFVKDLSSIVFLSYTTFDFNNKIQLIGLDDGFRKRLDVENEDEKSNKDSKSKKVRKDKEGEKGKGKEDSGEYEEVGKEEDKKYLKMVDNYYSNDNLLYISNELYVSECVSNQFVKMYKRGQGNLEEDSTVDSDEVEEENKDEKVDKKKGGKGGRYEVNLENYLKYNDDEEEDEFSINCDFLTDLIEKFF